MHRFSSVRYKITYSGFSSQRLALASSNVFFLKLHSICSQSSLLKLAVVSRKYSNRKAFGVWFFIKYQFFFCSNFSFFFHAPLILDDSQVPSTAVIHSCAPIILVSERRNFSFINPFPLPAIALHWILAYPFQLCLASWFIGKSVWCWISYLFLISLEWISQTFSSPSLLLNSIICSEMTW